MTNTAKLAMLKIMLGDDSQNYTDDNLTVYLDIARREILNWKYSLIGGVPDYISDVSEQDEILQLQSVVVALNLQGAENQTTSIENGIHRSFNYGTMVAYIRSNVNVLVRVW